MDILDIGAHKGETIDLVNKTFKVKKIFAFDADKDCISGINHKKLSNVHFYSKSYRFYQYCEVHLILQENSVHRTFHSIAIDIVVAVTIGIR